MTYDIWLQNTLRQCHGFNNCGEITHEIMIPLAYWDGYGEFGSRDRVGGEEQQGRPQGGERRRGRLVSIELHQSPGEGIGCRRAVGIRGRGLVSVELGAEVQLGVGDIVITNYRVWKP